MRSHLLVSSSGMVLLAVLGGCLVGPVDGIPCGGDAECPTGYWCDAPGGTCSAAGLAPDVSVIGLVDEDGQPPRALFIEPATPTQTAVVLHNAGTAAGIDLRLELSPISCLTWALADVPDVIAGGGEAQVPLTVTGVPGCGAPITVDWLLSFSERGARGTFDIALLPPP